MKSIIIVICMAFVAAPALAQRFGRRQDRLRQNCLTPENYYGSCVGLSYCPQIANIFQVANSQQAQQYVYALQRSCGTRSFNGDPFVCCERPITSPVTQRPNPFFSTEQPFVQPPTPNPFFSTEQPFVQPPTQSNRNPFLPTQRVTDAPNDWQTSRPTSRPTFTTTTTTTSRPIIPPTTSAPLIDNKANSCKGPDLRFGDCLPLKSCPPLLVELQAKPTDPTFKRFLQASNLICRGTGTQVCCPNGHTSTTPSSETRPVNKNEIPRSLPTREQGCGYALATYKKIVGGEVSKKGSWPWVALIGYDDGLTPFKCGGALISARHVVTAAHCIREDLTFVRLGEHDLSTDTETRHEDIPVARMVPHPEYNRRNGRSDIAMLYLQRNAEFTDTVAPICMPSTPALRQKSYVGYMPFVVGWGKTMEGGKSANVLNQLQIPVIDNQQCRQDYAKQNRLFSEDQFDAAVLCAGVLSGGKDTCQGDSGGPLMMPEMEPATGTRFYLIGVVSYGIGCARPNVPGVYTSVQYFMDWILEQVRNTP